MKTISMGYEEYLVDLEYELESGKQMGISEVMKFLESGQKFYEFWSFENPVPNNWKRILVALGRDNESNV